MRKLGLLFLLLLGLGPSVVRAQTDAIQGYCDNGGKHAVTQGLGSTNFQQQIIPQCTVTVYLTGTTTLATIYADPGSTTLPNPFTAIGTSVANAGKWET